jgi:sugar (pentulose or hexulose) kinase
MKPVPVILIFDVGKTNKKILLFNERYELVSEQSTRFEEVNDEDGFPCEDVNALSQWVLSSFNKMVENKEIVIRAINFSAYGASFVYTDENGETLLPLYNYLKPYPEPLQQQFYAQYGGEKELATQTASPVLGSLNSGLQLYRIKHEKPEVFKKIKYALHLPQYLSFLLTRVAVSEITSIGCHTSLWNFKSNHYHDWVNKELIAPKFPAIHKSDECIVCDLQGEEVAVGMGLHDSSAALIPYQIDFHEPFVLLSTGTWCISLNPFNNSPITEAELSKDCLSYLTYEGKPVKASRLFAGYELEQQTKRLADHFNLPIDHFNNLDYDKKDFSDAKQKINQIITTESFSFVQKDLTLFSDPTKAYHELMIDIVAQQFLSTKLVLQGTNVKKIFVDGGFSKNAIYMNLMAVVFPEYEVFAASVPQASSLGAALAIHKHWNQKGLPMGSIALQHYPEQTAKAIL